MFFPFDAVSKGPQLQTKKALLLLDLQNDLVLPTGRLPVPNVPQFLPLIPSLVSSFRDKGEIVWVRTEFRNPCSSVSAETGSYAVVLHQFVKEIRANEGKSPTGKSVATASEDNAYLARSTREEPVIEADAEAFLGSTLPDTYQRCCVPGSFGAQHHDAVTSCIDNRRDLVLVKSQYSALSDLSVVLQLRTRLVTDLYLCGSLSNISVYATALDAVRHGFNITLIEDMVGFRNEGCHIEAFRQMADNMGANGIDYQELMDDLAGLLGDVIHESDFTSKFQVSVPPTSRTIEQATRAQRVNEWVRRSSYTAENENESTTPSPKQGDHRPSRARDTDPNLSPPESPILMKNIKQCSPDFSPPRKRATGSRDDLDEGRQSKSAQNPSLRRASHDAYKKDSQALKSSKTKVRRKKMPSQSQSLTAAATQKEFSQDPRGQSLSTGDLPDEVKTSDVSPVTQRHSDPANPIPKRTPQDSISPPPSGKKKKSLFLDSGDMIGNGDCHMKHNLLDLDEATGAFHALKKETRWQHMYHRSGEVPRLVAVQGTSLANDTIIPIYRHPADESPELLSFDSTVNKLREAAEKAVGHTLNHVLIQHYRNGEDNISEHSDKTLDIVKGSSIVNLSLGAMRTMTLRSKKSYLAGRVTRSTTDTNPETTTERQTQRIRLPHNSLFVLGLTTNSNWLHAIRADKRPDSKKTAEELSFAGERISLTFRNIGTFIDTETSTIWGQGARAKMKDQARPILNANVEETKQEGEELLVAFGKENHMDARDFNWDTIYGRGFDVVNFVTKAV